MRITKILVLIGLLSLSNHFCESAELRHVNGKEVDLQPLIDWAAQKKGERPLKHWKLVQILENKGQTAYQLVLADIEGTQTQIALKNCPAGILQLLAQKQTLEGQLASVKQDHQAAAQQVANSHKRKDVKQAKQTEVSDSEMEKKIKKQISDLDE